jgi:hypothetical protein
MVAAGGLPRRPPLLLRGDNHCPVSLDLVRPDLAELQRARSAETLVSSSSHSIWPAMAMLDVGSNAPSALPARHPLLPW